jgi:hypothetical protein
LEKGSGRGQIIRRQESPVLYCINLLIFSGGVGGGEQYQTAAEIGTTSTLLINLAAICYDCNNYYRDNVSSF